MRSGEAPGARHTHEPDSTSERSVRLRSSEARYSMRTRWRLAATGSSTTNRDDAAAFHEPCRRCGGADGVAAAPRADGDERLGVSASVHIMGSTCPATSRWPVHKPATNSGMGSEVMVRERDAALA